MKTNMRVPTYALMLRDVCAVAAYLKTKLMTEAMTLPTRMTRKVRNETMDMGKAHHREKIAMGDRKTIKKEMIVPARKKANMMLEHILRIPRIWVISAGNAMVAPERSSFKMISTGLNQK